MIRRQIKNSDVIENSNVLWNAFVDLLALEDYADLTEVQRLAYLVFWYESEVQNGGHLQYFANSSGQRAKETIAALSELGMECQQNILNDALAYHSANPLIEIESTGDYIDAAQEDPFGEFDQKYYACAKDVNEYLEEYLKTNLSGFIELT